MLSKQKIYNEKIQLMKASQKYISLFSRNDLKKLKKINSGTDASIYRINNNFVLKLYNVSSNERIDSNEYEVLKTEKPKKFVNNFKFQSNCFDQYGVRLGYECIIKFAQEKQLDIFSTYLPLNPCYIDNSFRGCILKNLSPCLPISYFGFLPEKLKLEILYKLLPKFKELIEHHIYPTDIYNKLDSSLPHNNIVITPTFDPKIIDLDGKSVVYSKKEHKNFYYQATFGLITFILEFLYNQDLVDYFDEYDLYADYYQEFFNYKNIPNHYIDKLLTTNVSLDDISDFIDYKRTLKKI